MTAPNWSSPGAGAATCKFCGVVASPKDEENCVTLEDAYRQTPKRPYGCPWFDKDARKANPRPAPMTTPMTSRKALQDALDEWARANLPTESAGCITSWSDWIAAFVCDGVFGDSQMHPLSDIRDLDEVVRELGIQDSSTTPAEAVRELNAEIERLRSVAQTGQQPVAWRWKYKDQEAWQHCSAKYTPPHEAISEPLYTPVSSTDRGGK